ncbi:MAG: polysaccharide biosynthesis protein [Bacteroidetes bacterium]|nr:polysaccharide biosynthesis protein [Bacteroidota bacterium]
MNPIKKLASQTVIYGIPSIAGRFLNYLLTYLYTRVFATEQFGVNSEFYAYSGFFAVLLAFGMETGFFRFQNEAKEPEKVYSTSLLFIVLSSLIFLVAAFSFAQPIADLLKYPDHVEYIQWFALILALDSIASIPFVKLRAENKAVQFAGIKIAEIAVNISLNIFFLVICRKAYLDNPSSFFAQWYLPQIGVGYVFISNLIASAVKMLLLLPQLKGATSGFDKVIFGKMIRYSLPMVVIGFAGIINEMLDRMILKYMLPYDDLKNLQMLGIYGACYKLSILMSLFIQAFRFAGEPFFFAHADKEDSKKLYADVMKYFVIFCVFVFLLVMLYMNWFQLFIGENYRVGLPVVPILLMANLCLGIYVNLSIWYKLTDRTLLGAFVSICGALLTILLNMLFIPEYGYLASAWATLACYASMAIASYVLGQKYYPVEYDLKKISGYILLGLLIWIAFSWLSKTGWIPMNFNWIISSLFMTLYLLIVWWMDGRSLLRPKTISGS